MKQSFRLLIVEDSEDDAALLVRELQRGGLEPLWERVDTAQAMADALDRVSWDVVISDHGMPHFSAPAAMAMLRERYLDVPFIIVSGTMGEEAAVEAMRVGAQDYILKGKLAKLSPAVARELRDLEIRRAHARSEENLRQTREPLDHATEQLMQAEKLTALGDLVAGVAHEINNPLSGVLGFTQLILREDLAPEVRRRLETVCAEAERAAKIVKNLLTFARKQPPEKKHLGLNGIIEKTLELKAYHFRVNQILVETDLAADLPKTMVDFHQVQQVILNLLNNAEHALLETGRQGTVRITTGCARDMIEMRVSDTGPGIAPEIQRRIFEPFFTTKREGKGTGLGLSLCYGIIQEHGGTFDLESEPGNGATFIVRLPVLRAAGEMANEAPHATITEETSAPLSVFVVDDEPTLQTFLVELLGSAGHDVDTASDVPEALRKLENRTYDLIITDVKMPHGTGKDIHRAVATRNPGLAGRIIFTTGAGASDEGLRYFRQLGNKILYKPFRIEQMLEAVDRALKAEADRTAGSPPFDEE